MGEQGDYGERWRGRLKSRSRTDSCNRRGLDGWAPAEAQIARGEVPRIRSMRRRVRSTPTQLASATASLCESVSQGRQPRDPAAGRPARRRTYPEIVRASIRACEVAYRSQSGHYSQQPEDSQSRPQGARSARPPGVFARACDRVHERRDGGLLPFASHRGDLLDAEQRKAGSAIRISPRGRKPPPRGVHRFRRTGPDVFRPGSTDAVAGRASVIFCVQFFVP